MRKSAGHRTGRVRRCIEDMAGQLSDPASRRVRLSAAARARHPAFRIAVLTQVK
jgi:hypothetical protein